MNIFSLIQSRSNVKKPTKNPKKNRLLQELDFNLEAQIKFGFFFLLGLLYLLLKVTASSSGEKTGRKLINTAIQTLRCFSFHNSPST